VHDHEQLRVYSGALDVAESAYRLVASMPGSERFGLVSQIQRASASIPANIAEGVGRGSRLDSTRFLRYAIGSACELRAHLDLAERLYSIDASVVGDLRRSVESLIRQINALERHLQAADS